MPFQRTFPIRILVVCALLLPGAAAAQAAAEYEGAAAAGLALRRLGTTARLLHIAAHPDDENTALFAPLTLGQGIDAAYLSLTRGEGGQNGIGPELGTGLGIIRSEELLAARRLDGADQFFTRAIDYGYSKSAEEAFRHWPRDTLLADVVAIIRRYRPDVVVSVWSGTPLDSHGQHQAAGILAREAVLAAADPSRFPEQISDGLRPHATALYYRSWGYDDDPPDVELNTGALDPLLGESYHQIAMASRSRHRSQDQGVPQTPGPRRTMFDRVDPAAPVEVGEDRRWGRYAEGGPRIEGSLFEGVDTLLSRRAGRLAADATGDDRRLLDRAAQLLRDYETLVARARADYNPLAPWRLLPVLADARRLLTAVAEGVAEGMGAGPGLGAGMRDLHFHLRDELDDLAGAILAHANVDLDVRADRALLVPGDTFRLELAVWNGGPDTVRAQAGPLLPAGWVAAPAAEEDRAAPGRAGDEVVVSPGDRVVTAFDVLVPRDAEPTMPYYLTPDDPAPTDLYRWPEDPEVRGLPFAPPPVRGSFLVSVAGHEPLAFERDAERVAVDPRSGELSQPVKVVPAVAVALEPELAVLPTAAADRALGFRVRLRAQASSPIAGTLRLDVPPGWTVDPARASVRLDPERPERVVELAVAPPAGVSPGAYPVAASLETDRGVFSLGYDVVDYPHIPPHHLYEPAAARVRVLDVRVADVRVGYVPGAGDGVPEALDQLGVAWEPLEGVALRSGDLDRFDVIIVGARAYEVRDDLPAANPRLLDWARNGGTLIVQYSKYDYARAGFAPWPVTIARPHGRVTDPAAPVRVLEPGHPALTTPNRLGPDDWAGWVQERGLYFLESWEGPFTPLLAMSDPGEAPLTGSLLVAPLGEGTYVYTGLALFRQLPAGVPGAYRLLANLISLGAAR